jgi:hypothetical protein
MKALSDEDVITSRARLTMLGGQSAIPTNHKYLQRSTALMKTWLKGNVGYADIEGRFNQMRERIVLAWTAQGPRYITRASATLARGWYQPSNGRAAFVYNDDFAKRVVHAVMHTSAHGCSHTARNDLVASFIREGRPGATLLMIDTFLLVLEPALRLHSPTEQMHSVLRDAGEFRAVSIDACYKPCLTVIDQKKHGNADRYTKSRFKHKTLIKKPASVSRASPKCASQKLKLSKSADKERRRKLELHCISTTLTLSGCIVGADAMFSEKASDWIAAVARGVGPACDDTEVIKADSAAKLDCVEAYNAFKNVQGFLQDPLHRAFDVEHHSDGKLTPASIDVRRAHRKFNVPLPTRTRNLYYGKRTKDKFEHRRNMTPSFESVLTHTTEASATKRLKKLNEHVPYDSANEYFHDIAAIVVVHASILPSKSGKKQTPRNVIVNAATFSNFEYLQNNSRFLRSVATDTFVPTGTTANEAVHLKLNRWFHNVWHQTRDNLIRSLRSFLTTHMLGWVSTRDFVGVPPCRYGDGMTKLVLASAERQLVNGNDADTNDTGTTQSQRVLTIARDLLKHR